MKHLPTLLVSFLLLGSMGLMTQATSDVSELITIQQPTIHTTEDTTQLILPDATTYLNNPGQPQLPVITKTYQFPRGTIIHKVEITPVETTQHHLNTPLSFAQKPVIKDPRMHQPSETLADSQIYNSNKLYPSTWFDYSITIGQTKNTPTTLLSLRYYPVRYQALSNTITVATSAQLTIDISEPTTTQELEETYDLVIITPLQFKSAVEPLVAHKEDMGIRTMLATTNGIYQITEGRDNAEQLKNFLAETHETYGINYALLIGGMKGQRYWSWHVPVRYSHLFDNATQADGSPFELEYISDLYFADLYRYDAVDGYVFDDWDSNGNDVFAEWTNQSKDVLDMVPDISIGRLPVRYLWDLDPVIDKIITYETSTFGSEWFPRMAVLGGDSFDDQEYNLTTDYAEGKVETEKALSFMPGFEHARIWPEDGDILFTTENALEKLNHGHGFVYFTGHGNPSSWVTFPHNDFETKITFRNRDIRQLSNGEKLPVVVVGGCHNCQFDSTLLRFLTKGRMAYYYGEMTPKCWGWLYASHRNGGSIATIGNTGLGYGTVGDGPFDEIPDNDPDGIPDCIQFLGGWLEPHFFEVYNNSVTTLGDVHTQALIDYLQNFSIDWEMDWEDNLYSATLVDCKTVQQWVLFGDPTLRIGGYPPIL